ncbi:MAG: hypothetical protein ABR928_09545 [Terracidiphilus sp.]|jgi:hypothetical protein
MAEEMANAIAAKESNRTDRSTAKYNMTVRKKETEKAQEPVTVASETKEKPREEVALNSVGAQGKSEESNFDYYESLQRAVAEHFPKIIEGLMKIIDLGNPAGAKVLFDGLAKLKSSPGKVEHQTEVGVILSDIFGPGFDLQKVEDDADNPNATESADAGIHVGIGGREPE